MNQDLKNVERRLKQSQVKGVRNAHKLWTFGCPATPALTPPVSLCDDWKSVVRAGFFDSRIQVSVSMKNEEEKIKGERQHRGKPPVGSLTGLAGFSTPFPEGLTLSGSGIFQFLSRR